MLSKGSKGIHVTKLLHLDWKYVVLSHVLFFATPWTVPLRLLSPRDFPRQEYWSGCHFLLQKIFPTQGSNPSPALVGRFFATGPPGKPPISILTGVMLM